jgi:hypothetical protein
VIGLNVVKEGELTGAQIDAGKLIDQHYYAIASKATLLKPEQMPVPETKFKEKFGLDYRTAVADGAANCYFYIFTFDHC